MSVGIVGLPNVGKSTLFNALSSKEAEAANYAFCTIDPNVGIPIVAVVAMGYTLLGGMWSVTLTDAFQIALILAGLVERVPEPNDRRGIRLLLTEAGEAAMAEAERVLTARVLELVDDPHGAVDQHAGLVADLAAALERERSPAH